MTPGRWTRVKEVFHQALGHEPQEWSAVVARACGADETLRLEVQRLLAAHAEADGFIEPPAAGLSGRRLGRYQVDRLLGTGGMGEVYLARDLVLGRDVALKVGLSPGDDSRLRREAQHASRLNHPHICTVHEVGEFEGRVYVVMEYLDGQRLSELTAAGALPLQAVIRYGGQIADAVGYAHRHGVIHCDLKAANVVVTPDGRAKVLDFGLARRLPTAPTAGIGASASAQTLATTDAAPAGTLSSMAPELLRGEPADARSDVWALGVLLYEMAAGRRPFAGATGFELSGAILHEPPAPFPVPTAAPLEAIIRRCLEKRPEDRYQHAGAVRAALEAVTFRPSLSWPRLSQAARRRRWTVAAALLLALATGGATVVWREASRPASPAVRSPIAIMTFDNLAPDEEMSWVPRAVQSMLLTGLAQTPGLVIVSTQRLHDVSRQRGHPGSASLERGSAADVARGAGAGLVVVGSIVSARSTIRIDAEVDDLASGRVLAATSVTGDDLFSVIDELSTRIRLGIGVREAAGVRPIAGISSASLEAYRLYSDGVDAFVNMRLADGRALLEQAIVIDPTFADAYLHLALLSGPAGRPADRGRYLRKAAEHRGRLSEPRRRLMEVELARHEGRFTDAAQGLDELMARFPDLDEIATLAWQLHAPVVGPLADADRLLAITGGVTSANPSSTLARNTHGYALLNAGRFADALREFEAYVALAPREPNPHDGLAEAHLMMGLPEQALEHYDRSTAIDPAFHTGGRAWVLAILGRFDEALREEGSPSYLTAIILARTGRYREAGQTLAEAVATARTGGDAARLAGLQVLSSLLALERGDYAGALTDARSATETLAAVPQERGRFTRALLDLIGGIAELRHGQRELAQARLDAQRRAGQVPPGTHPWWRFAFEAELALATGELDRAAAAVSQAEPPRKQFFNRLVEGSVLANDLVFRDAPARLARARGDLRGAVEIYRRLLTFGPAQRWVAVFEPRYVLEIARLFEQLGDRPTARAEYTRFLQFWKQADPDLPELAEARRGLARLGGTVRALPSTGS